MAPPQVLLVDDEREAVIEPLLVAFESAGLSADFATTWEEAYESFLLGAHNLVVADWNLPGSKNGLLLLARLKLVRPSTSLILFSGYLDEDQRTEVEQLPFVDGVLSKGATDLTAQLHEAAQAAVAKAQLGVDWASMASGYRAAASMTMADVEALESRLRGGLR